MFKTVPLKTRQWTLLEPVQSGPNPHALLVYFNNTLQPTLRSHRKSVPFYLTKTLYTFFTSTVATACPAQLILLNVVALIIQGDSYTTKPEYSATEHEQRP